MTDRGEAGQPPRFSRDEALRRQMFAVRLQAAAVTLSSVLATFTVSATLVLSKALCLSEMATITSCEVWMDLALFAVMMLSLKT